MTQKELEQSICEILRITAEVYSQLPGEDGKKLITSEEFDYLVNNGLNTDNLKDYYNVDKIERFAGEDIRQWVSFKMASGMLTISNNQNFIGPHVVGVGRLGYLGDNQKGARVELTSYEYYDDNVVEKGVKQRANVHSPNGYDMKSILFILYKHNAVGHALYNTLLNNDVPGVSLKVEGYESSTHDFAHSADIN